MTLFPPILQTPAFAWACAALAGGCLAAAALWAARRPLRGLADGFMAMPPLRRALAALAVVVAVAYAGGKGEEGVSSKEQVVSAEFSSSFVAVGGTQQDVDHHTYSLLPAPYSFSPVSPVSAQLELFRDGSFVAWSNSGARVYRRVNPDDWDGGGIPNDEDDDPRVAADEPRFGPRQSLPQGAHTNNYYWVDLAVRDGARTTYRQVFTLDASQIQTTLASNGREIGLDSVSYHSTEI